jgi:hypothetical protein
MYIASFGICWSLEVTASSGLQGACEDPPPKEMLSKAGVVLSEPLRPGQCLILLRKFLGASTTAKVSAIVVENLYFTTPDDQEDIPSALSFEDSTGYILNCTFDGVQGSSTPANIYGGNTFWEGVLIRSLQAVLRASGMQPF